MATLIPNMLEFFYVLIGVILFSSAWRVLRDTNHPARVGTALFWTILGVLFAFGSYIPSMINGILILAMGVITLLKQVKIGKLEQASEEESQTHANRIGNRIFLPCVLLALLAVVIAQFTPLGGQVGIGLAAVIAFVITVLLTRATPSTVVGDSDRMIQQVGITGILPQLLAALGVIFNKSGVGDVISQGISTVVPMGSPFIGVVAYCLGMMVFTMIMGNAYAAFTVITAGIGIPFVVAQGGDPVIAGALAMTAGFCGTLMTPMAANFNALPAALLEMKDLNKVIKVQVPMALTLVLIHIALMYYWAF
ncbi:hypothetical protein CJP16_20950 [Aeromonas sobria]|uniref:Permease n=1 Tax=Aeromonas sobria TaxID=646 RepID=A0A2N3ING1_AERSO|nr:DUF979 domain-containing protein [Aeromonas sobria]PKQ72572.1 hypothetical protein CJP16_20950 [Aeromonas sobria]